MGALAFLLRAAVILSLITCLQSVVHEPFGQIDGPTITFSLALDRVPEESEMWIQISDSLASPVDYVVTFEMERQVTGRREGVMKLMSRSILHYRYVSSTDGPEVIANSTNLYRSLIVPSQNDLVVDYNPIFTYDSTELTDFTGRFDVSCDGCEHSSQTPLGVAYVGGRRAVVNYFGYFRASNIDRTDVQSVVFQPFSGRPQLISFNTTAVDQVGALVMALTLEPTEYVDVVFYTQDHTRDWIKIRGEHPNLGLNGPSYEFRGGLSPSMTRVASTSFLLASVKLPKDFPFTYAATLGGVNTRELQFRAASSGRERLKIISFDPSLQSRVDSTISVSVPATQTSVSMDIVLHIGGTESVMVRGSDGDYTSVVVDVSRPVVYSFSMGLYDSGPREWSSTERVLNDKTERQFNTIQAWEVDGYLLPRFLEADEIDGESTTTIIVTVPYFTQTEDDLSLSDDEFAWERILLPDQTHPQFWSVTVSGVAGLERQLHVKRGEQSRSTETLKLTYSEGWDLVGYHISSWTDSVPQEPTKLAFLGVSVASEWVVPGDRMMSSAMTKLGAQRYADTINLEISIDIDSGGVWVGFSPTIDILLDFSELAMKQNVHLTATTTVAAIDGIPHPSSDQYADFIAQVVDALLALADWAREGGVDMVGFPAYAYAGEDEAKLAAWEDFLEFSIPLVRDRYPGLVATAVPPSAAVDRINSTVWEDFDHFTFPLAAPLNGSSDNDLSVTSLELRNMVDLSLSEASAVHERWGLPCVLYGSFRSIPASFHFTEINETLMNITAASFIEGSKSQAAVYDAIFHEMLENDWIEGLLASGYTWFEDSFTASINGKLAEGLFESWGTMFGDDGAVTGLQSDWGESFVDSKDRILLLSRQVIAFNHDQYVEFRTASTGLPIQWSDWTPNHREIRLEDIYEEPPDSAILWVQGLSVSGTTSTPSSWRFLFDDDKPVLLNPTQGALHGFEWLDDVPEDHLWVWSFGDASDFTVTLTVSDLTGGSRIVRTFQNAPAVLAHSDIMGNSTKILFQLRATDVLNNEVMIEDVISRKPVPVDQSSDVPVISDAQRPIVSLLLVFLGPVLGLLM